MDKVISFRIRRQELSTVRDVVTVYGFNCSSLVILETSKKRISSISLVHGVHLKGCLKAMTHFGGKLCSFCISEVCFCHSAFKLEVPCTEDSIELEAVSRDVSLKVCVFANVRCWPDFDYLYCLAVHLLHPDYSRLQKTSSFGESKTMERKKKPE